ncbi:MAG: hypothetical protein RRA32_10540 [bacterium]|nr:hypothetical protein [bacterium]
MNEVHNRFKAGGLRRSVGLLAPAFDKKRVRMVTHRDLPDGAVSRAVAVAKS